MDGNGSWHVLEQLCQTIKATNVSGFLPGYATDLNHHDWTEQNSLFLMWIWKVCRAECWNKNHDIASCEQASTLCQNLRTYLFMVEMRSGCSHTCRLFWTLCHLIGPGIMRGEAGTEVSGGRGSFQNTATSMWLCVSVNMTCLIMISGVQGRARKI
jgi:hypothetical protein